MCATFSQLSAESGLARLIRTTRRLEPRKHSQEI
jgi:hypothetical protein